MQSNEKAKPTIRDQCGSLAGHAAHQRHNEHPCDRCRKARSDYQKAYRSGAIEPREASKADRQREALALGDELAEKRSKRRKFNRPLMPEGLPTYPDFLKDRGSKFWHFALTSYDIPEASHELLAELCRTLDECERINAALSSQKVLWYELGEPDEDTNTIPIVIDSLHSLLESKRKSIRMIQKDLGLLTPAKIKANDADDPLAHVASLMQNRNKSA